MKLTIQFSNPFSFVTLSAAMLFLGWAIGAQWGHTASAGWALLWALIALLVHDMAMAVLVGVGGYKFAQYLRKKDGV